MEDVSGPDYILDLSGRKKTQAGSAGGRRKPRGWLAIRWRCCGSYSRIYKNRSGTAYTGNCPKCGRPVHIRIGEGGTNSRFFEAF